MGKPWSSPQLTMKQPPLKMKAWPSPKYAICHHLFRMMNAVRKQQNNRVVSCIVRSPLRIESCLQNHRATCRSSKPCRTTPEPHACIAEVLNGASVAGLEQKTGRTDNAPGSFFRSFTCRTAPICPVRPMADHPSVLRSCPAFFSQSSASRVRRPIPPLSIRVNLVDLRAHFFGFPRARRSNKNTKRDRCVFQDGDEQNMPQYPIPAEEMASDASRVRRPVDDSGPLRRLISGIVVERNRPWRILQGRFCCLPRRFRLMSRDNEDNRGWCI
jgi:hypothetical protein